MRVAAPQKTPPSTSKTPENAAHRVNLRMPHQFDRAIATVRERRDIFRRF